MNVLQKNSTHRDSFVCQCAYGYTGVLCTERVAWLSTDSCTGVAFVSALSDDANRALCEAESGCGYHPEVVAVVESCVALAQGACTALALNASTAAGNRAACVGLATTAAVAATEAPAAAAVAAENGCAYRARVVGVLAACEASAAPACAAVDVLSVGYLTARSNCLGAANGSCSYTSPTLNTSARCLPTEAAGCAPHTSFAGESFMTALCTPGPALLHRALVCPALVCVALVCDCTKSAERPVACAHAACVPSAASS